ncbi:MAG: hypothetical protein CMM07_22375, partial [Rhodopirellula sp.]|nr:hypothetical protein [Rhodopirellula sp.]
LDHSVTSATQPLSHSATQPLSQNVIRTKTHFQEARPGPGKFYSSTAFIVRPEVPTQKQTLED